MPTLDVAMPIALLLVVLTAMSLNKRVERRLASTVEQKSFKTRDVIFLTAFIGVAVSVIAYTSLFSPGDVLPNILTVFFLGSYSVLLFTFSQIFSNMPKSRAQLLSAVFGAASLIAGLASLTAPLTDAYALFRAMAFFVLASICFIAVVYEQKKIVAGRMRWYLAIQPPALFLLLFVFFNVIYVGTINVWFPFLLNVFGFIFAVLIILYLSTLFSWKTVGIFAVLLTILDVILVFTGPMVAAARTFTGLGLPVLVYLPNIPVFFRVDGIAFRGLGLGDFFFAGILAVQTYKKFGRNVGVIASVAMTLSFGIWEAFLPEITAFFNIEGFPATVCIITGWLPVMAWKMYGAKNQPKFPVAPEEP